MSADTDRRLRVLIAVGERELEGRLARELPGCGIAVSGRCLDGPSLLDRASEPGVDAVLAAPSLHRLTEETLAALRGRGLAVVLLAQGADDLPRVARLGRSVPAASPPGIVARALREAAARGAARPEGEGGRSDDRAAAGSGGPGGRAPGGGRLLAVASGKGAPGATTVALALAALLSERADDVALLDGDLRGGNVAPLLDLDPRRGLLGIAAPDADLGPELQEGPGFSVLCGIERAELAAGLGEGTLGRAAAALRQRSRTTVCDLGVSVPPGLLGPGDQLLVVCGADLLSIWNARIALPALRAQAGGASVRAAVNRRAGRHHYRSGEVERALSLGVAGVVREEPESARRAVALQLPLPAVGGRVVSDLRALAAALCGENAVRPEPQPARAELRIPGLAGGGLRW